MKKIFKKVISVFLALSIVFSMACVGVLAEAKTAAEELKTLEKNIPIVEIPGFGDKPIYKGLSTETEEDDENIWAFSADEIVPLIMKHLPNLIFSMMFGKYERMDVILTDVLGTIFGAAACDENGVPDPDTGLKYSEEIMAKEEYGKRNSYCFAYDWRLDMHTISVQLHEFIEEVMLVTGAEEVGLVSFSMGGAVMMTYLYEYYYLASPEERDHIHSAIFLSGAMNGVECCGDPFSGNIVFDSTSLIRLLTETISANENLVWLSDFIGIMYSLKMFEPLISYTNNRLIPNLDKMSDNSITESIGTIPAFYALMSGERYYQAESFVFNTDADREKYSVIIEKSRYYHENVQANSDDIIGALIEDGKNFAVISEYGHAMLPVTSDNDRMADGMIGTYGTSFGATCAEIDGILGENYVQAVTCECGKNHVSPDNQIDASTCKYPDVTWFAKKIKHENDDKYFADLIDIITYSKNQVTVHTYADMPQFMVNQQNLRLVPMNETNAGKVVPFEETTPVGKFLKVLFR